MKNPIQPIIKDADGQVRFKENKIVQELLDTHPNFDMNDIARKNFSDDDRQQFAQLIGYILSGYSELMRYVDDVAYSAAEYVAEGMDWRDAKIKALEGELAGVKSAVNAMKPHIAKICCVHSDDLK